MSVRQQQRVVAKTADFTIKPYVDPPGTLFTNLGATGTVIFTLPVIGSGSNPPQLQGAPYVFDIIADYSVRVAAASGTIATLGNAAANSVGYEVASNKIGRRIIATHDGTKWFVVGIGVGFCVNGIQVDSATAAVANAVLGLSAAQKVVGGVHTQVAQSDTIATGLATVVAVVVTFQSAPTAKQQYALATIGDQAGTPAAGSFLLKTLKSTLAVSDDFTDNIVFNWFAFGT